MSSIITTPKILDPDLHIGLRRFPERDVPPELGVADLPGATAFINRFFPQEWVILALTMPEKHLIRVTHLDTGEDGMAFNPPFEYLCYKAMIELSRLAHNVADGTSPQGELGSVYTYNYNINLDRAVRKLGWFPDLRPELNLEGGKHNPLDCWFPSRNEALERADLVQTLGLLYAEWLQQLHDLCGGDPEFDFHEVLSPALPMSDINLATMKSAARQYPDDTPLVHEYGTEVGIIVEVDLGEAIPPQPEADAPQADPKAPIDLTQDDTSSATSEEIPLADINSPKNAHESSISPTPSPLPAAFLNADEAGKYLPMYLNKDETSALELEYPSFDSSPPPMDLQPSTPAPSLANPTNISQPLITPEDFTLVESVTAEGSDAINHAFEDHMSRHSNVRSSDEDTPAPAIVNDLDGMSNHSPSPSASPVEAHSKYSHVDYQPAFGNAGAVSQCSFENLPYQCAFMHGRFYEHMAHHHRRPPIQPIHEDADSYFEFRRANKDKGKEKEPISIDPTLIQSDSRELISHPIFGRDAENSIVRYSPFSPYILRPI